MHLRIATWYVSLIILADFEFSILIFVVSLLAQTTGYVWLKGLQAND